MAGNYIVIGSKFQPFSYQEMLQPVQQSTAAHQAVESEYAELATKAGVWENIADEQNDPNAYRLYKSFADDLAAQADILAREGLSPSSRKSVNDVRTRYANDIIPIEQAYTRRKELADEQRKAKLQNPTLIFQRDLNQAGAHSSLDRFLEDPTYDYGAQYSGELLARQVNQAASNLAKELRNYGKGRPIDAYTSTFLQQHGFSSAEVLDAINNPERASSQPILNSIVESVIGSSRVGEWADDQALSSAYNYARQGLWGAIGQTDVRPMENYEARAGGQGRGPSSPRIFPINSRSILSPNLEGAAAIQTAERAASLLGYNMKSGKFNPEVIYNSTIQGIGTLSNLTGTNQSLSTDTANIWKGNRLKSKEEFVEQGSTQIEKNQLGKYYDTVVDQLDNLGIGDYTRNNISNAIKNLEAGKAGGLYMDVIDLPLVNNEGAFNNIIPLLTTDGDQTGIREIKSFKKNGEVVTSDKIIKKNTFYDNSNKLKGSPRFSVSPIDGGSLIMQFDGASYLIPKEKLGTISNSGAINIAGLREVQQKIDEGVRSMPNNEFYYTPTYQELLSMQDAYGASVVRDFVTLLSLGYKPAELSIIQQ